MDRVRSTIAFAIFSSAGIGACGTPAAAPGAAAAAAPAPSGLEAAALLVPSLEINARLLHRFAVIRPVMAADPALVTEPVTALGRMLFFEPRISKNHDLSCNSCHTLDTYGVDGRRTSSGHRGQKGIRNTPTVYNAAASTFQFWDARAEKVEDQVKGPVLSPVEMAMPSEGAVTAVLKSIPGYKKAFQKAFPSQEDPISFSNVSVAIGAFERKLATPGAWDRYLAGDKHALTREETAGLRTFTNLGCMVCHTGEVLGGGMLEKVGVVEPWPNQEDQGRYELTKVAADRMLFKVPTLRNVAQTAPYFHDGSAPDLPTAVRMMAKHQLGFDPSPEEVASIVAWLKALTGPLPEAYIARPTLPPSGPRTPRPDPL